MKMPVVSSRQLIGVGPWFGAGLLATVAMVVMGLQAFDLSAARSELNTLLQRMSEARSLRDRLGSEADPNANPVLQISPQRSLAAVLRQRIEQAGLGFAQIMQLQLLERRKGEGYDQNGFSLMAQLPARDLERWLFNLERLSPNLLVDRVDVRLATPPAIPVEARMLRVALTGRAIVDDQIRKP